MNDLRNREKTCFFCQTIRFMNFKYKEFTISTDPADLDIQAIHHFLSTQAYWSLNIPFDIVSKAIKHSLNFGLFHSGRQIGFARIISDYATIAYLGDVYVLPEYRKQGLSKWLMETIMAYPDLQGLRRWILLTGDAHELYKKFGWKDIAQPQRWMELHNGNIYKPEQK